MLNKKDKQLLEKLLSEQWNGDNKMIEHCMKSYVYMRIDENIVQIGKRKPSITKQLWFDDEKPIPKKNKDMFISYNLRVNGVHPYKDEVRWGEKLILAPLYEADTIDNQLVGLMYSEDMKKGIRVSQEVLETINEARSEIQSKYEKRLRNYWKRYSDYIYFSGYWVNR